YTSSNRLLWPDQLLLNRLLVNGARSPSGKAKVCKTFIGGSIPPRASKLSRTLSSLSLSFFQRFALFSEFPSFHSVWIFPCPRPAGSCLRSASHAAKKA